MNGSSKNTNSEKYFIITALLLWCTLLIYSGIAYLKPSIRWKDFTLAIPKIDVKNNTEKLAEELAQREKDSLENVLRNDSIYTEKMASLERLQKGMDTLVTESSIKERNEILQSLLKEQKILEDFSSMNLDSISAILVNNFKAFKMDTSSQRILLFGDSMVDGIYLAFRPYCKKNGHKIKAIPWHGSSTDKWGRSDSLYSLIKSYKPTYIIACIGSNELFIRDIVTNRTPQMQSIIRQLGANRFVWIAPPNWKEDTGIYTLIYQNVDSSQVYPSKILTLERRRDGAHPTQPACEIWADSIAQWIMKKSKYPIRMIKPE